MRKEPRLGLVRLTSSDSHFHQYLHFWKTPTIKTSLLITGLTSTLHVGPVEVETSIILFARCLWSTRPAAGKDWLGCAQRIFAEDLPIVLCDMLSSKMGVQDRKEDDHAR